MMPACCITRATLPLYIVYLKHNESPVESLNRADEALSIKRCNSNLKLTRRCLTYSKLNSLLYRRNSTARPVLQFTNPNIPERHYLPMILQGDWHLAAAILYSLFLGVGSATGSVLRRLGKGRPQYFKMIQNQYAVLQNCHVSRRFQLPST